MNKIKHIHMINVAILHNEVSIGSMLCFVCSFVRIVHPFQITHVVCTKSLYMQETSVDRDHVTGQGIHWTAIYI